MSDSGHYSLAVVLSESVQQLLREPTFGSLATVMPDGSPQLTLVWVDTDGEHVLVNTIDGNQKVRNVRRDDRVAMTVCSREHPASHVRLRGRVVEVTREGATDHVEELSQLYTGSPYALHSLGPRVIIKIEPTSVKEMLVSDYRERAKQGRRSG